LATIYFDPDGNKDTIFAAAGTEPLGTLPWTNVSSSPLDSRRLYSGIDYGRLVLMSNLYFSNADNLMGNNIVPFKIYFSDGTVQELIMTGIGPSSLWRDKYYLCHRFQWR